MSDRTDGAGIASGAPRPLRVPWTWLTTLAIIATAALIYRPWRPIPWPVSDWGGIFPLLTGQPTAVDRFRALSDAFARDGRYQPALMAAIAITWSAFGDSVIGWQWVRFAVLTAVIVACIALARALGATYVAAAAAALLLVVSGMAHQSWVLLQLAEPRGTLVLVVAALVAVGYGAADRWRARAVAIVALLILAILYKETFIVAVPFVLALALWARRDGQWLFRAPTRRDVVLIAGAILAIGVVNVIPILGVRRLADAHAYGARYDVASVSLAKLRNVLSALFLPVTRVWWFPANLAFLAAIIAGVVIGVRRHGRAALLASAVLSSLVLAGAAMYLPWFALEGYYALAFLPGLIGLFALALTWLWRSPAKMAKLLAVASCGVLAVYGTLSSLNYINRYRASRSVEERTARALAGLNGHTLITGVPSPDESGGFATALRDYALTIGVADVPAGRDVACPEALNLVMQGTPAVVVVFSALCPGADSATVPPTRIIAESYGVRDWKTFAGSRHEVSARIWASKPATAAAQGG